MSHSEKKTVLISGASFAGLSTAYWMAKFGYDVTIVEIASGLRVGGTAVDIKESTVDVVKQMGIFDAIRSNRLSLEKWDFKGADDTTLGGFSLRGENDPMTDDEFEIERSVLVSILHGLIKDKVKIVFNEGISDLKETTSGVNATFSSGKSQTYDLIFGCDGIHSAVRRLWFGPESQYMHFLEQYFSITMVEKSLIKPNTAQMYNVPGKGVMLNAYKNKTDIIFCFVSEKEIPYNYRDEAQQRQIIVDRFKDESWRCKELLKEIEGSKTFYFDKLCQIKMPEWSKGRVALVGDAAYCASPAAGRGGSLAIDGAAALAKAFEANAGDHELAFKEYESSFRPFIEDVQKEAVRVGLESLVPRTEEAIRIRNSMGTF
ncbi:MAG: FAD-binding monooxygenase [Proteobacteria bacterium]|nr:MAG: FAD-binding monooxygenase [Pseudomonadota bacterium]